MAVVINDFEVIAEPPAASAGTAPPAEAPAPPSAPEVERVLRSLVERLARVEAH